MHSSGSCPEDHESGTVTPLRESKSRRQREKEILLLFTSSTDPKINGGAIVSPYQAPNKTEILAHGGLRISSCKIIVCRPINVLRYV